MSATSSTAPPTTQPAAPATEPEAPAEPTEPTSDAARREDSSPPRRARSRLARTRLTSRRTVAVVVAVIAAAALAAVVAVAVTGGDDAASDPADGEVTTATAVRTDLVLTDELVGTLGYGDAVSVTTASGGVVTGAADAGETVELGETLFSVDLDPAVLLAGDVPAYRELASGVDPGPDVAQLEQGLADLGHGDGLAVDETFDAATADAVEAWEADLGRPEPDGVVALGEVVFQPGPVRVAAVDLPPGAQANTGVGVLRVTSTEQVVTIPVHADDVDDYATGLAVDLVLPDGTEGAGTVTAVGVEPTGTDADGEPTVDLTVVPDDPALADCCTSGEVDVVVERSREDDVVAVPVTALLALLEGGYAVEVVDPASESGTRLVGVETGTVVGEQVAVAGIEVGTEVVVPS